MRLETVTVAVSVCRRGDDKRRRPHPLAMTAVTSIRYSASWTLIRRPFRSKYTVPSTRENNV